MKKNRKYILPLCLLPITLSLVFTGCGKEKTGKDLLEKYCKSIQEYDYATADGYIATTSEHIVHFNEDLEKSLDGIFRDAASDITYEIFDEKIKQDGNLLYDTLLVRFTYNDYSDEMIAAINAATPEYINENLTDEQFTQSLKDSFIDALNSNEQKQAERIIEFQCLKNVSSGTKWVINNMPREMEYVRTCNVEDVLEKYYNSLSDLNEQNSYADSDIGNMDSSENLFSDEILSESSTDDEISSDDFFADDSPIDYYVDNGMQESTYSYMIGSELVQIYLTMTYKGENLTGPVGIYEMTVSLYSAESGTYIDNIQSGEFREDQEGYGALKLQNGAPCLFYTYYDDTTDEYMISIIYNDTQYDLLQTE